MTTNSFQGKTAIVVGGTSGIGKATARLLLQNGASVHLVSRNQEKIEAATQELSELGEVRGHQLDITNRAEANTFIGLLSKTIEKVDYLVNASGIFRPKAFADHTVEDYAAYLDLNRGFFFITQAVIKKMKAGGSIVNVGSMWAKQALKATPSSAYSMQKAGLHSLTQHLAMELAEQNIRVNAVSPGVVETPVYEQVFGGKEQAANALKSFHDFQPLGHNGQAEDVAFFG